MAKTEIDPTIVAQYVGLIAPYLTEETYTAYGISTVLNQILVKDGMQPVRSQMMYNYARNGMIVKGEKITGQTLRTFTKGEVATFVVLYCLRNGIKVVHESEVNPDQLELDLEIETSK